MKRFLAITFALIALSGCQKPDNSTPISSRDVSPRSQGHAGGTSTVGTIELRGAVFSSASSQNMFNEQVRSFLEATMPRDYVGYVDAMGQYNTGVYIGGRINLDNGQGIRPGSTNGNIAANSEFVVSVFDYWENETPPPIPPVYFKKAQGWVNGQRAFLKFWDDYGSVELEGTFSGEFFTGTFDYDTQRTWDNNEGRAGTIGQFKIRTCDLFRCQ